jgi:hypothetical protein
MLKLELELTKEEKQLLDEAVWFQLVTLAVYGELHGLSAKEKDELETYKIIYKKLGNKLEKWVEEV